MKDHTARARDVLGKHFASVTRQKFGETLSQTIGDGDRERDLVPAEAQQMGQLTLLHTRPAALPLRAYLASALTGLGETERHLIFHLSDSISTVCSAYDIELYEPRKKTDPVHHQHVPDHEVFRIDRERVLDSDLVIHLAHFPSTGAGEELDFAYNALVPIVLVYHSSNRVSRMVTGIPAVKYEVSYEEPEQLREALHRLLPEIRPVLEARKLAFSKYDVNIVGARVRSLRERLSLTREDIAGVAQHIDATSLKQLEESPDRFSNPSLILLRELAVVLKTSVADLVEPDLEEQIFVRLQEWVADRSAARFGHIHVRDRNKILRRVLLRLIDSLERDDVDDSR